MQVVTWYYLRRDRVARGDKHLSPLEMQSRHDLTCPEHDTVCRLIFISLSPRARGYR